MVEETYYDLLGVDRSADVQEIKDAYRRISKIAHPDKGGTNGLFRQVRVAYETLVDSKRRAEYDCRLDQVIDVDNNQYFDNDNSATDATSAWERVDASKDAVNVKLFGWLFNYRKRRAEKAWRRFQQLCSQFPGTGLVVVVRVTQSARKGTKALVDLRDQSVIADSWWPQRRNLQRKCGFLVRGHWWDSSETHSGQSVWWVDDVLCQIDKKTIRLVDRWVGLYDTPRGVNTSDWRTRSIALASLLCSLLSGLLILISIRDWPIYSLGFLALLFVWTLPLITGFILGFVARRRIKRSGTTRGRALASVGTLMLIFIIFITPFQLVSLISAHAAQNDFTRAATNAMTYYIKDHQSFSGYIPKSSIITYVAASASVDTARNNQVGYFLGDNKTSIEFSVYYPSPHSFWNTCWYLLLDERVATIDTFGEAKAGMYYYGENATITDYCPEHVGKWYTSFPAAVDGAGDP